VRRDGVRVSAQQGQHRLVTLEAGVDVTGNPPQALAGTDRTIGLSSQGRSGLARSPEEREGGEPWSGVAGQSELRVKSSLSLVGSMLTRQAKDPPPHHDPGMVAPPGVQAASYTGLITWVARHELKSRAYNRRVRAAPLRRGEGRILALVRMGKHFPACGGAPDHARNTHPGGNP
jgi:hypothetical protein